MKTKQGKTQKRRPFLQTAAVLCLAAAMLMTGCAPKAVDSMAASAESSPAETADPAAVEPEGTDTAETPILSAEQPQRAAETPMGEAGTWTIFVYLCGADLESDAGMASINLMEIMKAAPGDKVNIIVQTGGSPEWGLKQDDDLEKSMETLGIDGMDQDLIDVSPDALQRYRVTDHMELLEELPLASMGAEDTLYDFLKWGVETYPAEHMGVIFWDHGGSGTAGVCRDELFDKDTLLPFELNEAFQRLYPEMTDRFEFIGFDACMMSTVEVANAISPFARYMYASEETIPGYGWAYTGIINALNEDPAQNGEALGKVVCDNYRSLYKKVDEATGGTSVDCCTLSITDLEKMNAVTDALDALGDRLVDALDNPAELKKVTHAVLHTENFAYPYLLDMGMLAENLESVYPEEATALRNAQSEAIVYSTHGSFSADSTGMAIFYPRSSQYFAASDGAASQLIVRYALCAPSKSYYEFVKAMQFTQYRALMSGVPNVRVKEAPHLEEVDEENVKYTMTLDPADLDKVAEMNYQVWLLNDVEQDGEMIKIGMLLGNHLGVQYDEETGVVTDDFDDSWKWVTLNGLQLELNIQSYDDDEVIYRTPILLNGDSTNLIIRWTKATDSYELVGTYTGFDSETNAISRMVYPLRDGDVIIPRYEYIETEYIEAGIMEYPSMGVGLSTYGDTDPEYAVIYDKENTKLEYTVLDDGEYYLQYYLTDVYGSKQAFDPLAFTMKDKEAYVSMQQDEAGAADSAEAADDTTEELANAA